MPPSTDACLIHTYTKRAALPGSTYHSPNASKYVTYSLNSSEWAAVLLKYDHAKTLCLLPPALVHY